MKELRERDALISPGVVAFARFRFDVGLRRLVGLHSMGIWAPVSDWVTRTGRPWRPVAAARRPSDERCHYAASLARHRCRSE